MLVVIFRIKDLSDLLSFFSRLVIALSWLHMLYILFFSTTSTNGGHDWSVTRVVFVDKVVQLEGNCNHTIEQYDLWSNWKYIVTWFNWKYNLTIQLGSMTQIRLEGNILWPYIWVAWHDSVGRKYILWHNSIKSILWPSNWVVWPNWIGSPLWPYDSVVWADSIGSLLRPYDWVVQVDSIGRPPWPYDWVVWANPKGSLLVTIWLGSMAQLNRKSIWLGSMTRWNWKPSVTTIRLGSMHAKRRAQQHKREVERPMIHKYINT